MVDSSVWIDFFNGKATPQTNQLLTLLGSQPILVGDLILCEVLQGARTNAQAQAIEKELRKFDLAPMLNANLAIVAAAHYRALRNAGITIRKTIDVMIGTFCIVYKHKLLHSDRDFDTMESCLGLQSVPAAWAVHESAA